MSNFIRYPLPIRKDEINWDLVYMKDGGSQLIEMLEKDIPIIDLVSNPQKYGATASQLQKLLLWIKHNTVAGKVQRELGLVNCFSVRQAIGRHGTGLVTKLSKHISIIPHIDEHGNITSRYSFLGYDSYLENDILIVKCHLIQGDWCCEMQEKYKTRFDSFLFLRKINDDWREMSLINYEKQMFIDKYEQNKSVH